MPVDKPSYMREWRKTPTGQATAKRQLRREKAKDRAYRALAARHQEEFKQLFDRAMEVLERTEGPV